MFSITITEIRVAYQYIKTPIGVLNAYSILPKPKFHVATKPRRGPGNVGKSSPDEMKISPCTYVWVNITVKKKMTPK